jgi:hypothetical protein
VKRLEGEVLEALASLGGQEALTGLEGHTVDPHQFLGLELNPRAAAIAELVLWIGYLQWHFRTQNGLPGEPILRAFHNIRGNFDAVLQADVELARDAHGVPITRRGANGSAVEVHTYANARQPEWPEAEFIVGNPPFMGGKDIRARLGNERTEALWAAHPAMNESADLVMYWWDHAAGLLAGKGTVLRRFGLVTTNSITGVFQRRVLERHLLAKAPISLVMAIPDHPWTKAISDAAAVRIAMTVVAAGTSEGILREVVREEGLETEAPIIEFSEIAGAINFDLTIGADVSRCATLLANKGLSSRGVALHGGGFIVTPKVAEHLGLGRRPGLEHHIRNYRNGRDLTSRPRGVMAIDLFGLDADEVRARFPEVYQHIKTEVKEKVSIDSTGEREYIGRDWNHRASYKNNWWVFGEPRSELRPVLDCLTRYIVTVETAKYRIFQFLDASVLPDNKLVAIGSEDSFALGILSSRTHTSWASSSGGLLEDRPVYIKSRCFDPFPFPAADDLQKHRIRIIAEDLDAHRKRVLAEHPHLTLTGLYNVLEKLQTGASPDVLDPGDRRIFDDGLVLILKEYHDRLDTEVAAAYGWGADLSDNEILTRLVALNQERVREDAAGQIRWLRPEYQIPRFGPTKDKLDLTGGSLRSREIVWVATGKPNFPISELEQTASVLSVLNAVIEPATAAILAKRFLPGRRVLPQVEAVLAALVRVGGLVTSPDGGRSFLPRRAA